MKKALNISLTYLVAALAGGVFFREFTKFNNFTGVTALGKLHTHLFLLGTGIFLFAALFSLHLRLEDEKTFRSFMIIYNIGLPLTAFMMFIRGVFQVLGTNLTKGLDASISGVAGIGHILIGAGLILFLVSLKKAKNRK